MSLPVIKIQDTSQAASVYETRAEFVTAVAAGQHGEGDGAIVRVGDLAFVKSTGATTLTDLADWLPSGDVVSLKHFPVTADGTTDDATPVLAWITYLNSAKKKGYVPQGTYAVSYVRHRTLANNVEIEMHPDATFLGLTTKSTVAGDNALTSHTVTEYTAGNDGFVVVYISGGSETVWTEGTEYTVSGQTIDWNAGSSPHGALASGDSLRIVSADPMIELGQNTGTTQKSITWRGGTIDNSVRGYASAVASGSALAIYNFASYLVEGVTFQGAADHETAISSGVTDTGLTVQTCDRGEIRRNLFTGQADLGVYITGGADAGGTDDGTMHLSTGNIYRKCQAGFSAKREARAAMSIGDTYDTCYVGFTLYITTTAIGGGRGGCIGGTFVRCGKRAIDVRRSKGFVLADNVIRDLGYEVDGTTEIGTAQAINILGSTDGNVHDNRAYYDELTLPASSTTYAVDIYEETTGSTVQSSDLMVHSNAFPGFTTGIRERGTGTSNIFRDNDLPDATSDATAYIVPTTRKWHYTKSNISTEGIGSTAFRGTWTPELRLGATATGGTINTAKGLYERVGNVVTLIWEYNETLPASPGTGNLRLYGQPYAAYNDVDYKGNSSLSRHSGLNTTSDVVTPEVSGGVSYMQFWADGAVLNQGDVTGSTTVTLHGGMTYIVEPEAQS